MSSEKARTLDDVYSLAESIGIVVDAFVLDGDWHRVPVVGKKKGNLSGAYCLSEFVLSSGARVPVGILSNHVKGIEERLTLKNVEGVSPNEMAEAKKRMAVAAEESRKAKKELQEEVAAKALAIWSKLPVEGKSDYLNRKKIKPHGARFARGGTVVVPVQDVTGKLWSLQFIQPDGSKRFLSGGAKAGHFHIIGGLPDQGQTPYEGVIAIAEGFATGGSIHQAKGFPVFVAFDAGNLLLVAQHVRKLYAKAQLLIFADHDIYNGFPVAFIKQSDTTPAVREKVSFLKQCRPDVEVELVADDDPRLRDRDRHPNTGVAKAVIAAAAVCGFPVVPLFEQESKESQPIQPPRPPYRSPASVCISKDKKETPSKSKHVSDDGFGVGVAACVIASALDGGFDG